MQKSKYSVELTSWVTTIPEYQKPTFDGNFFALEIMQVTKQHFFPVTAIAYEAQIWEWTFWRANFFFHFGKQITCQGTNTDFSSNIVSHPIKKEQCTNTEEGLSTALPAY